MHIAASVATNVTIIHGMNISVGFSALAEARTAIMLTGINVGPHACRHKNMIWASDATDLLGLISCRLSIVFKPKGVAALSNPKRLAEKFIIICPIAGWPFGIPGKSFVKKGPMILDNKLTPPALSAIHMNPMKRAMMPINFRAILTDVQQVSIIPSTGF